MFDLLLALIGILALAALFVAADTRRIVRRNARLLRGHARARRLLEDEPPPDGGRRLRRVAAIVAPLALPITWARGHPRQAAALAAATIASVGVATLLAVTPKLGQERGGALSPTSPPSTISTTTTATATTTTPSSTAPTAATMPPATQPPAVIVAVPYRPGREPTGTTSTPVRAPGPTTTTLMPPPSTTGTTPACLVGLQLAALLDLCVS